MAGLAIVVAGVLFMTGVAFAHHPEVTAGVDCKGLVTFTSTAWAGSEDDPRTRRDERDLSRTNPKIQVSYSTGGAFVVLPQKTTYAFNKANNYTFTDTFTLPSPLPASVVIKVQAIANWANGVGPGDSRQTSALTVPPCPTTTTTSTTQPPTTTTTEAPTTTTTEAPTTTTTQPATTTTAPGATTTTHPTTTTTAAPGSTTTTETPTTTLGASQVPPTVPTRVEGVTITRSIPVTGAPQTGGLAFTGWDYARVVIMGILLLSFGFGVVSLMHRRRDEAVISVSDRMPWR
jgi:hypothetical protein